MLAPWSFPWRHGCCIQTAAYLLLLMYHKLLYLQRHCTSTTLTRILLFMQEFMKVHQVTSPHSSVTFTVDLPEEGVKESCVRGVRLQTGWSTFNLGCKLVFVCDSQRHFVFRVVFDNISGGGGSRPSLSQTRFYWIPTDYWIPCANYRNIQCHSMFSEVSAHVL